MESFLRFVEFAVTIISALVQIVDTFRNWEKDKHQKSNRPDQG